MERPTTTQELSAETEGTRTARLDPSRTASTRRFGAREAGSPRDLVLERYRLPRPPGGGGPGGGRLRRGVARVRREARARGGRQGHRARGRRPDPAARGARGAGGRAAQ